MKTSHLIPDILRDISRMPKIKTGKVDKNLHNEIEQWLSDYKIKRLFQWHWFIQPLLCGIEIFSAKKVALTEKICQNLKVGYLQIGDCPNGDRVYVKELDFSIWYWSHDEAKDWDIIETAALYMVYPSIDYLLLSVRNQTFIPCDSYSGREYFEIVMQPHLRPTR